MDNCIIIVDNGFFKLVKKEFELKTKVKKKLLQTFRNICKNENLKSYEIAKGYARLGHKIDVVSMEVRR